MADEWDDGQGYDGDDAVPCAFCGAAFSAGADPCLAAAHARIAELEAENERMRIEVEFRESQLEPWMRKAELFEKKMHEMAGMVARKQLQQPPAIIQLDADATERVLRQERIAAFRARAADPDRFERVRQAIVRTYMHASDTEMAEAVLAAADGEAS